MSMLEGMIERTFMGAGGKVCERRAWRHLAAYGKGGGGGGDRRRRKSIAARDAKPALKPTTDNWTAMCPARCQLSLRP